jgi:sigma-B regulation protein RsbU (phosphoserine phosphatase)
VQAGERERLEREMQLAAEIQKGLWPGRLPHAPGCSVAWRLLPARQVGGDLLDIGCDPAGRLRLVIGDVSGKGLPAAVFGESARGMVGMAWQAGLEPGALLGGMNRLFCQKAAGADRQPRINLALAAAVIDGPARCVRLANAGFPYPVHVAASGMPPVFLELPGLPLAVLPDFEYGELVFQGETGDLLVFASDGIAETRDADGVFFGFDRLLATLGRSAGRKPDEVIRDLIADLEEFSGGREQADDRAVLAIRFDPT